MTLNYKGIPYRESFLSYPDIRPFADSLGIEHDDSYDPPRPTLPVILHYKHDRLVKAVYSSASIARYLDSVFPDRPVLASLPPMQNASEAYYNAFRLAFSKVWALGYNIVVPTVPPILDDRGARYFIEDRGKRHKDGKSPLDWGADDPNDDWAPFLEALDGFSRLFEHTTPSSPLLMGDEPCYADFALASWLTWFKRGNAAHFDRIVARSEPLERHYRACEKWIDSQGEVVEWEVKH